MIASLNAEGVMGAKSFPRCSFPGSSERDIRKGILEDDLLEAVIGLPEKLFYGTGIPAALLIINKNKPSQKKNKVLFINSDLEFEEGKNQNKLRDIDIDHILSAFDSYKTKNDILKLTH